MKGFTLLLCCHVMLNNIAIIIARDSISPAESINDDQIIVSARGVFALGFFTPGNSKNRYVGIWYYRIPTQTVVWVANRDKPLTDSSGAWMLNETGILVLLNRNKSVIWSSNSTRPAQHPVAKLLDTGNFIVQESSDNDTKDLLWQSFDYPVDTILPGQKFGKNLITGLNQYLSSWRNSDDPSQGNYSFQVDIIGYPQWMLREGTVKRYRFGSWNGIQFSGAPQLTQSSITRFNYVSNAEGIFYEVQPISISSASRLVLTPDGIVQRIYWSDEESNWRVLAGLPVDDCDYYENCGAYASCNVNNIPPCKCLDGFVSKTGSIHSSCVRRTSLNCVGDGFLKFSGLKLPDTASSWFDRNMSLEDCRTLCLKNCSCTAYAALDVSKGPSGCLQWYNDLIDIKELAEADEDIFIRMAASEVEAIERKQSHKSHIRKQETVILSCVLSIGTSFLCLTCIFYRLWKTRQRVRKMRDTPGRVPSVKNEDEKEDLELPMFDLLAAISATDNFSTNSKLGEGGFGSVYKGSLHDGREVAIKRLSKNSRQGIQEFKNEVKHIAKLQHRNLVRLLGYCIEQGERLLVYELMPNKSLDFFIFDERKSMLLDWPRRLNIINGIARGLLYLHQDSRHRIVHRDLKAGNVLLDSEMNPKISDFGLARSFGGDEFQANTDHVVGTYGYLPPEYMINGTYSTKTDVFSFGVLVLEIVSGKRNRGFCNEDNLLAHAWRLFTEGKCSEIIDAKIGDSLNLFGVLRSIHVGLLCVQLSPDDRPSMQRVVMMLSSEGALPHPKLPGLLTNRNVVGESSSSSSNKQYSNNDVTVSLMSAR